MENKNEFFVPINEVARELDVPAHTLRYWEKQFAGAIRPVTGAGNRRYYRRETIEKLRSIKSLLYDKGMTIAGVKKVLHNGTFNDEVNFAKKPVNAGNNSHCEYGTEKIAKTPVNLSRCGEMSADPMSVLLLVGLGVDELSMTPWSVMSTKKIIRSINFEDVRDSALTVLQMDDADSVNSYMHGKYAQTIRDLGISSVVGQVENKNEKSKMIN